jgi:ferredoxin-type protein NapF
MQLNRKAASAAIRPDRRRRWRYRGRLATLSAVLVLLLPHWSFGWASLAVPSLSPYVAVAAAIAVRSITITALLALPVLCLSLLRPRWFCRFACPTGLLVEMAGRVRARPAACGTRLPAIGPWVVLLTVGGACLGYPLLLWLDPLAIFSGCVNALRQTSGRTVWISAAGLPALLLSGLLWPGAWCRRLCPLGATQDLLALAGRELRRRGRPRPPTLPSWRMLRRTALGVGLGAIGAGGFVRALSGARPPRLRPPGAVGEAAFTGLCVRCGNCGRVCPSRIIHPDLGHGVDSLLTPTIRYDDAYCLESCRRCTEVCPSGALLRLALAEKRHTVIGLPHVDMNVCLLGDDRECALCRTHCPYDAIRIVFSETNYSSLPQVDPGRCNGCGACQVMCPTSPIKAIVIQPCS